MFKTTNAKRFRAIFVALVITIASNYAISLAAKPNESNSANSVKEVVGQSSSRSGNTTRPAQLPPGMRSGNTTKPAQLPPGM